MGMFRDSVKMLFEFRQGKLALERHTVIDEMKVMFLKVDDFLSRRVFHVRVAHVPFARNCPVEDAGAAGDFPNNKRDLLLQNSKRLPQAIAGNASANGVEFRNEGMQILPESVEM